MPQNKKTEQSVVDLTDLPQLTDKQARFWREKTINGKRPYEAYMLAFDCSNMNENSIYVEASRLCHHPKIALWDQAAARAEIGTAIRTKEQRIKRMERLSAISEAKGNMGAAVQAEGRAGELEGHYVEKHQDVGNQFDPQATLREVARDVGPDVAAAWAKEHGIEWQPDDHATKH